eukprot:m.183504 g.183504  ORF g.183504 m.183504 type:complete len:684 (-) comp10496_c0_seq6:830-2881(-)
MGGSSDALAKAQRKLAKAEKSGDVERIAKAKRKLAALEVPEDTAAAKRPRVSSEPATHPAEDIVSADELSKLRSKLAKAQAKGDTAKEAKYRRKLDEMLAAAGDAAAAVHKRKKARRAAEKATKEPSVSAPSLLDVKSSDLPEGASLLLFHQYVSPEWTADEQARVVAKCQALAEEGNLQGRCRVAPEGCCGALTGPFERIRDFCQGLRAWKPAHFGSTDFKLAHGLTSSQEFQELNIFPVSELVSFGFAKGTAPPLSQAGTYISAQDFHKKLAQPDVVVVDVRNTYETAIGHFTPPPGGAELLDPRIRRTGDFPAWLGSSETRGKLSGKQVMMYCNDGMRCERATALLRQLGIRVKEVFQLFGGVHRYLEEFKDGGYWSGKNYVFDRRFAHGAVEGYKTDQVISVCAACGEPWDRYRGKKKCSVCRVPLLVCTPCQERKQDKYKMVRCPDCIEEGAMPEHKAAKSDKQPDADAKKRKEGNKHTDEIDWDDVAAVSNPGKCTRLYLGNLPFSIEEEALKKVLPPMTHIFWATDKESGKFYGTAFVEMATPEDAGKAVAKNGMTILGRAVKIEYCPPREGTTWPPVQNEGGGGDQAFEPMRERPDPYCKKFFMANVSYNATDDDVYAFFENADISQVRWLTHKNTGEFKGCGFIEFMSPTAADIASLRHGEKMCGRRVRLDWAE